MKKVILNVEGMTCSACSNGLEKYLNKQEGIKNASVNLVLATVLIEYEDNIKEKDLEKYIEEAGFKCTGKDIGKNDSRKKLIELIVYGILAVILMYMSMKHMLFNIQIETKLLVILEAILTTIFMVYGIDIIKNGLKNLVHKMPNMDSLVGIGVIVNYGYSMYNMFCILNGDLEKIHNLYFEASAMIILFVKLGRYIHRKNKNRAVDIVKNLVNITPQSAVILKDGKEKTVTINEINKKDIVISKVGEKISVDGIIVKGETHTDESFITGESKPVAKKVGDKVIAGSINFDGYIEYEAERIGKDSSISNIVKMVVEATSTKSPITLVADKISGYFVPAIFCIAILSFVLNFCITLNASTAITALVSVLVVACPCALGLATPLAMVVSIGKSSKNGILVKSSETLEAINKIDTVVLDKTGTITKGKMQIVQSNIDKENMKILKTLESKSNHPIAKSIYNDKDKIYSVSNLEEVAGMGIKGIINGKKYYAGNNKFLEKYKIQNKFSKEAEEYKNNFETIVYLFTEKELLAIVGLSDEIKGSIKETIKDLKAMNKKVYMLTGDNKEVANNIAKKVGIENIISDVSPKEKKEKIEKLNVNKNCLMVGDGINDSPALKTATIGVSMQTGTDISMDASDVILLNDNMQTLCELFKIGKKTMKIIHENLFWALFYNICMIPLATGILPITINPMIASFAMTLSSLTVVLNSLRLLK